MQLKDHVKDNWSKGVETMEEKDFSPVKPCFWIACVIKKITIYDAKILQITNLGGKMLVGKF